MLAVLRQRNFALLWAGALISLLGDWLLLLALPLFIYQRTGSALATGAMFIVETLPGICLGSIAGVFVDRWDRRKTMIFTDLARALVLLPLLLIQGQHWLWFAYAVAFGQATLSQFFAPAQGALIPLVVGEQHLTAANAVNSLAAQLMRMIGPLAGGVLFGLLGLQVVIIADSLSYIFSAIASLLVILPAAKTRASLQRDYAHTRFTFWREWLEGLQLLYKERSVSLLFIIAGTAMLGDGVIKAIGIPFLSQAAGGNTILFSWIVMAQGVGAVIGALVLERVSRAITPFKLLALGALLTGISGFIEVTFPVYPVVIICTGLMGAPIVFFFVSIYTVLQQTTADQYRGRTLGTYATVNMFAYLVGMIISSFLATQLGSRYVLLVGESCYFLAGALAFLSLWRRPILTCRLLISRIAHWRTRRFT